MRSAFFLLFLLSLNFLFPAKSHCQNVAPTELRPPTKFLRQSVAVPVPSERAIRYYKTGNVLWAVRTLWDLLAPACLLLAGFSARLRNFSHKPGRHWFFANAIFFSLLIPVLFLLDLPLDFFAGFIRPHQFGLSNQTLADWFGDWLKVVIVFALAAVALAWLPFWIIRKSPRRWWLICSVAAVPLAIFFLLIKPIWIDPLFDKFGPMQNAALEKKILFAAGRANITGSRVFEVNKSAETKAVNAYVTGVFNTKRIVVWDTAIAKLNEDELLAVIGHEIGHYVLGHMFQAIVGACVAIFAGLFFIHKTGPQLIRRFKTRFGFDKLSDVASVPLFIFLFQISLLVLTPMFLAISRHNEHEADRFGLELTRNNFAAATAFVKIQKENLAVPYHGKFFKFWRSSHPDLGDRIEFCNNYTPWLAGQPLKYQK